MKRPGSTVSMSIGSMQAQSTLDDAPGKTYGGCKHADKTQQAAMGCRKHATRMLDECFFLFFHCFDYGR